MWRVESALSTQSRMRLSQTKPTVLISLALKLNFFTVCLEEGTKILRAGFSAPVRMP
jgi:hypothetical protein